MCKQFKNNIIIEFAQCISLIVIFTFIGISLLTCAFILPVPNIEKNAENSAQILEKEGPFPALAFAFTYTLDNNTDSLMITKAQDNSSYSPFNKALMIYSHEKGTGFENNIDAINNHYTDKDNVQEMQYSRYWHGYLIFLKPLLELFDITGIRIINAIVQLLIMFLICYLLNKRNLGFTIPPLLISYLFFKPVCTFMCLQFSSCFYVLMIGILLVLYKPKRINIRIVFSLIGILTTYFDLLTYPIVTFCFPAVIVLSNLFIKNKKTKLLDFIKLLLFWLIGYFGMWAAKWGLVTIFTESNGLEEAFKVSSIYLNTDVSNLYNLPNFVTTSLFYLPRLSSAAILYGLMLFTPYTIVFIFYVIKRLHNNQIIKFSENPSKVSYLKPYILICIIPLVWYIITYGHSFIHFGFTYKAAISTIFTLMVMINLIITKKRPTSFK